MRRTGVAVACAVLLPMAARAEPISMTLASATGGAMQAGVTAVGDGAIDLGTVWMSDPGSTAAFLVTGLDTWVNYAVTFTLKGAAGWDTLRAEILDPLDQIDDDLDPSPQPGYVPAGYSTSSNEDGFSFAQDSALERSATFAGGSATVTADENTNRGDILMFSGLSGAESARVTFGLRDSVGDRSFLVFLSAEGGDALPTPEPASMLLIGTGLVGIAAACRRRRRQRAGSVVAESD